MTKVILKSIPIKNRLNKKDASLKGPFSKRELKT